MTQVEIDQEKAEKAKSQRAERGWLEVNLACTPNFVKVNLPRIVKPILEETKGLIKTWHFLYEGQCWKGKWVEDDTLSVVRLRFQAKANQVKIVKNIIWNNLCVAQKYKWIGDFYFGCHGIPDKAYIGEAHDFNEKVENPVGWKLTKQWLQTGSELALLLYEVGTKLVKPGDQTHFRRFIHFFANQLGKAEWTIHKGDIKSAFMVVDIDD